MPRVISFVVLVAIILITAAFFFQVMAQFVVPLFLAALLAVLFRPLHEWFQEKCHERNRIAALLTTVAIVLIVLLPLSWILTRAITDSVTLAKNVDDAVLQGVEDRGVVLLTDLRDVLAPIGIQIPKEEDALKEWVATTTAQVQELARQWITPVAVGGAQIAVSLLVGSAIMVLSLYYFLADGPGMIQTLMRLSPLDDRYELQLLEEFAKISRAVVLASLLSALAQGLLAGIGFFLAPGLDAITLLVALTMLLALVPFVGSAAVWVPCCLWLYINHETVAAIVLALYCALVVSTVDNLIKPLVLHGQSGIHPLVALLSILGGVTALGPIGILVGPMLVAFLQALLNMLQIELASMGVQQFGALKPEGTDPA